MPNACRPSTFRFPLPFLLLVAFAFAPWGPAAARAAQVVAADAQPLRAQAARVAQVLDLLGAPLSTEQAAALDEARATADGGASVAAIQRVLDPLCLAVVRVGPEDRVTAEAGAVAAAGPVGLAQGGWRVFLVKVLNDAGATAKLRCTSPSAEPLVVKSTGASEPRQAVAPADVPARWMDVLTYDAQPFNEALSGLAVEYRVVQVYSRDAGRREAKLVFDLVQGPPQQVVTSPQAQPVQGAAAGSRGEVAVAFDAAPAVEVTLRVDDDDGSPTTGQFVFRDDKGRVYPSRTRRLGSDFFFHDQVYRADGETVLLPPGSYEVMFGRGPEYRMQRRLVTIKDGARTAELSFRLARWIKLADYGWYSGDHHIHAAGCQHYESPTEGVTPEAMFRHIAGEDLNVGCVLSWGPCWYAQKKFFSGKVDPLSTPRHLMRYDVEVSGFPSSHAGHLCLLRLTEDDYPGTTRIEEWPSWDLPVLKWGKSQGAVVGFSHSGWGLAVSGNELPSYEMPRFDSIGANEYVVDVTHDAVDFISACDTPVVWELSVWYHTLNCGYQTRISGETDFPCIYGDRVGMGRSYIKLTDAGAKRAGTAGGKDGDRSAANRTADKAGENLDYDAWVAGLKAGRCYVSDGLSHLFDFTVGGLGVGDTGPGGEASVLPIQPGVPLKITLKAAALLEEKPREDLRAKPLDHKPFWHLERARFGNTRQVRVELVANSKVVDSELIEADGRVTDVTFEYTPTDCAWVAARIIPSSHTNPVFLEIEGKPIRASRRSAKWCLEAIDVCWRSKQGLIREAERPAAAAAYEAARQAYRRIHAESRQE